MVSFSCEGCGDVLTKKKLDQHRNQCYGASFTCLDCMIHFDGTEYRAHTSCISEAQKYQGALYRPEKEKRHSQSKAVSTPKARPLSAYVEDAEDDGYPHLDATPPEAPSPPSAAPNFTHIPPSSSPPPENVNVFDFLVGNSTPNQSTLDLAAMEKQKAKRLRAEEKQETSTKPKRISQEDTPVVPSNAPADMHMVRFEEDVAAYQDDFEDDYEDEEDDSRYLVEYGSGPVHTTSYETPARKLKDRDGRRKKTDTTEKQDKKRKRLHVETSPLPTSRAPLETTNGDDSLMTDAPPATLHSGLTGGLNRLLSRPSIFPPSPDYSGDASPGSPLKRSKKDRMGRGDILSNSIMSMISVTKPRKSVLRRVEDESRRRHRPKSKRVGSESARIPRSQRLIEYQPMNSDDVADPDSQQLVLYQAEARAELLLSLVTKGPESERGCSMNKALKRYHRERFALGVSSEKSEEEKELWRSIRLRRNDRGEVVVFF